MKLEDHGPFSMDDEPGRAALEAAAAALLVAARAVTESSLAGKPVFDAALPGASVRERAVLSVATQAIWNAAIGDGLMCFNVVDGFAHGLGTTVAQQVPGDAQAIVTTLVGNLLGYESRVRAALVPPSGPRR